jgi:hypothetical protein
VSVRRPGHPLLNRLGFYRHLGVASASAKPNPEIRDDRISVWRPLSAKLDPELRDDRISAFDRQVWSFSRPIKAFQRRLWRKFRQESAGV